VDTGGCFSAGGTSALVLKGVNLIVHSGEVMAILGSKGSGKRALLDVISKRNEGSTRGQVLLNGASLTKKLFQQRCGYVTHSCDFIPGLSVSQTLHYTPTIVIMNSFFEIIFTVSNTKSFHCGLKNIGQSQLCISLLNFFLKSLITVH
jgi:ABC-type cobalamin/Fe3+-siderophores transport system ATPase subunit